MRWILIRADIGADQAEADEEILLHPGDLDEQAELGAEHYLPIGEGRGILVLQPGTPDLFFEFFLEDSGIIDRLSGTDA